MKSNDDIKVWLKLAVYLVYPLFLIKKAYFWKKKYDLKNSK